MKGLIYLTVIERISKNIEKTKAKIAELQQKLRELEAQKTDEENLEIIKMVRGKKLEPSDLAAVLDGQTAKTEPENNGKIPERIESNTHENED